MAFFSFLMLCPHEFFRAHQILNIYLSIRHQQRFWTFSRMFYMFYLLFAEPVISLHMSLVAEVGVNVASCIDLTYLSKCCCAQLCNCLKMSILCFFFFVDAKFTCDAILMLDVVSGAEHVLSTHKRITDGRIFHLMTWFHRFSSWPVISRSASQAKQTHDAHIIS